MKERVTKFDLENAFKALDEIAIPKVGKVRPNRPNLKESVKRVDRTSMLVEDYSFGLWLNDDDENIYIDIVKTYRSEKEALEVGRKNLELSIYDLEDQKVIWIDYSK